MFQNVTKIWLKIVWEIQDPNKRPAFDEIVDILKSDPDFITDLVVESEYLDCVDFVDQNQDLLINNTNLHVIEIQQQQNSQPQELSNISNSNGFIDL